MAAASLAAREHDPAKERRLPGQRRASVSKTLWVPVKVQELQSVPPHAALPRLGPRQGRITHDYPAPGHASLGSSLERTSAVTPPRPTSPSRPRGVLCRSAGLGAGRAERPPRPAPPRPGARSVPRRTAPAGVDVNHGNAERAAARRRRAGCHVPAAHPCPRRGRRRSPGGSAQSVHLQKCSPLDASAAPRPSGDARYVRSQHPGEASLSPQFPRLCGATPCLQFHPATEFSFFVLKATGAAIGLSET